MIEIFNQQFNINNRRISSINYSQQKLTYELQIQHLIYNQGKSLMWNPHSYRAFKRYIDYFSPHDKVFSYLQKLPPIVSAYKIEQLRQKLIDCQSRKSVLLHTGDCAQPFEHVNQKILENKVKYYKGVKLALEKKHNMPAIIIGRIAGQYAKPRSLQFTQLNGVQIHNYKGDNVNSVDINERQPKQHRLTEGYFNSVVTHNYLSNHINQIYTSHEGLILPYQAAFTKNINHKYYCLSAHMIWIGERTRQLDGAHVEFFRGLQNPIGVKISSKIEDNQFLELVKKLNPKNQSGKLLVIIRMGHSNISQKLKHLVELKHKHNLNFIFVSDPMHGNTYQSQREHKLKIRNYDHITLETNKFIDEMKKNQLSYGISLQSTFQDVTQCIGGAYPHHQHQIDPSKYLTKCDPRLNQKQIHKLIEDISLL